MNLKGRLKNKLNDNYKGYKVRKNQEFYNSMVKSKSRRGFFNENGLRNIILMVTVFLQIVSLATTYKGSEVYFGGIKLPLFLNAPFLFALSIQVIVFYVSNTIRINFKKWLIVVLIIATLTSTYFSYIGIYNYINSPISYLEERYGQVYDDLTQKYEIEKGVFTTNIKEDSYSLFNSLAKNRIELEKNIIANKSLMDKINKIKVNSGTINAQTGAVRRPNINDYNGDTARYYSDMARYNSAIVAMQSEANKQDSSLKSELYQNEVKAILGGKTLEEFTKEDVESQAKLAQIDSTINSLYTKYIDSTNKEKAIAEKITDLTGYVNLYISKPSDNGEAFKDVLTTINTLDINLNYNTLKEGFQENLNKFVVISSKDGGKMKTLDELKAEVYEEVNKEKYTTATLTEEDAMMLYTKIESEVKNMALLLASISNGENTINLNDEKYKISNLYVLPVTNIISENPNREMAIFCLIFAILVDGLSIIFALTNGGGKNPLFAKSNSDIVGKSVASMEDMLILSIQDKNIKYKEEMKVIKTRERLEGFISKFSLIKNGGIHGFSMWCKIENLKDYELFLATLCQFNLGIIVDSSEIDKDLEDDGIDEKYFLIKTKLILWINEKISVLLNSEEYLEDIKFKNTNLNYEEGLF